MGPLTGATYETFATGGTWNGNPVMAFTAQEIRAFITAGDGVDANGTGLQIRDDEVVDVDDGWSEGVPTFLASIRGEMRLLYAPQGRAWDEAIYRDQVHADNATDNATVVAILRHTASHDSDDPS